MTKEEIKKELDNFIDTERLDEKSKRTIGDYRNAVNKLIDFLPNEFEITKSLMIDFKEDLTEKGFKVKSKNKYIVIVNKFLKYLKLENCTLKKFKEQQKTSIDDPIWEQEHKRMLRWAKKLDMMDMYLIIKIFAHSGARIDELKYFTVESLDSNFIKGAYNKGKERTLIMTNELKRELKTYCKENHIESGYIFVSPVKQGKMLNNSTIWRRLKKISKSAKINPNKIHPHAWRHLFAKKCKENGIDLDELRDILGHNDIKTTAIYTMTSNKEKKNKLERIKY
jgi:site-specific recombinase XerD